MSLMARDGIPINPLTEDDDCCKCKIKCCCPCCNYKLYGATIDVSGWTVGVPNPGFLPNPCDNPAACNWADGSYYVPVNENCVDFDNGSACGGYLEINEGERECSPTETPQPCRTGPLFVAAWNISCHWTGNADIYRITLSVGAGPQAGCGAPIAGSFDPSAQWTKYRDFDASDYPLDCAEALDGPLECTDEAILGENCGSPYSTALCSGLGVTGSFSLDQGSTPADECDDGRWD